MKRGFIDLVVVLDWAPRRVMAQHFSTMLVTDFCVEALEAAMDLYGTPEIFNTVQGSRFSGEEFVSTVLQRGAELSMDGRGVWRDNVFIERFGER